MAARKARKATAKKSNQKNVLYNLVLIGLLTIAGFCGAKVVFAGTEYTQARSEYTQLAKQAVVVEEEPVKETALELDNEASTVPAAIEVAETAEETEAEELAIDYPKMDINAETLVASNADYIGWIYIPALDLSYPMVQGNDNEQYLHETFEGTANASGAIFEDCRMAKDLTDMNTIIYGHNMKNDTMFGALNWFEQNPELCASNPYIYIYGLDGTVRKYEIFSYGSVSENDELYLSFSNDDADGYDTYVSNAIARSEYSGSANLEGRPNLMTLSTCYTEGNRFVVVAACVGTADM